MDTHTNSQDIQNDPNKETLPGPLEAGSPAASTSHLGPSPEPGYIQIPRTPAYPPSDGTSMTAAGKQPSRRRAGLLGLMLSAMLALGMLLGGAGAGAIMLAAGNMSVFTATAPAQAATSTPAAAAGTGSVQLAAQTSQATINSIYKAVSPSVVMITSVIQGTGRFGVTGQATGTGVVVDKQGDILTNYHVIEGASSIKVEFADGSQYTATVAGTAPQDDLAVIKVAVSSDKLTPVALGASSTVQVGDEVIAIGYPYSLDQSVTSGIVSGLNRDGSGSTGSRSLTGLIQIDAAINPGNSGGPLLNAAGQVIGINTMIESPVEGFTGVGLAIPIDQVKALLSQLEQGGQVARPWIGISGTEISSSLQQQYSLPVSAGILVMDVTAGSPAADAGLQSSTITSSRGQPSQIGQIGDIIVAIDRQKLSSVSGLTAYLNSKQPGDKITLTIIRAGRQQDVTITLQAWAANTSSSS